MDKGDALDVLCDMAVLESLALSVGTIGGNANAEALSECSGKQFRRVRAIVAFFDKMVRAEDSVRIAARASRKSSAEADESLAKELADIEAPKRENANARGTVSTPTIAAAPFVGVLKTPEPKPQPIEFGESTATD